jgi:hypothetical protein
VWSERQQDNLLPVSYYHLVFTLPHQLNGWVQLHPQVLYRLLFQAAWATLKTFGQDPKRLGGELGMTAVLHTWGQNLSQHVHLHCLVPGGALQASGHWQAARSNYLFPVKALSGYFRGKMVSLLRRSAKKGELHRVTRTDEIDTVLNALMDEAWVVYTKACLNHARTVVTYLGRYTHRIAITNARVLVVDDEGVLMRYKDYRDGNRNKTMRLGGVEFVRRYLMHILPKGLMRIRNFGFLANRCRKVKLTTIRNALAIALEVPAEAEATLDIGKSDFLCKRCREGQMRIVGEIAPDRTAATLPFR